MNLQFFFSLFLLLNVFRFYFSIFHMEIFIIKQSQHHLGLSTATHLKKLTFLHHKVEDVGRHSQKGEYGRALANHVRLQGRMKLLYLIVQADDGAKDDLRREEKRQ